MPAHQSKSFQSELLSTVVYFTELLKVRIKLEYDYPALIKGEVYKDMKFLRRKVPYHKRSEYTMGFLTVYQMFTAGDQRK